VDPRREAREVTGGTGPARPMKFGFLSEADPRPGQTYGQRYRDLFDEVILAEQLGFDIFGLSEQHFALGVASVSAPECLFSYLFARTTHIRFRHAIMLLPYMINHPLRVAERIATEDVLSNGRIELGVGRGNTTLTLRAFGVSPDENKDQSDEALDLIMIALTQDPFRFEGKFFKVPPRSLVPKAVQFPHPPIWAAAMSPDSIQLAAGKGIGVWATASDRGWGYLERVVTQYKASVAETAASGKHVNNSCAVVTSAHCAETQAKALEESSAALIDSRKLSTDAYGKLAKISKDYAYMQEIADTVSQKGSDLDYMLNESASLIIGSPEDFVKAIERYQRLGADEVWFRLDSLPHEVLMRSINLIGRHVIPRFKEPWSVVEDPEVLRARIRASRAAGAAESTGPPPNMAP
jgi:alkanesulfonate monooxygenase SsuD/methylene tetrahydromethanopterin reductase-like flavin-dependent oxidoreductase (luciferase family)